MIPTPNFEIYNLFTNAFDAKRGLSRGRGSYGKHNSRFCTDYIKHGYTIDLCYQKHEYPQVHICSLVANAHSIIHQDIQNTTRTIDSQNPAKYLTVMYWEKYVQLVCLLHQANFILSINNDVGSNYNQFTSLHMVHIFHS